MSATNAASSPAKAVHQVGVIDHDLLCHLSLGGTAGRYKKVQNSDQLMARATGSGTDVPDPVATC